MPQPELPPPASPPPPSKLAAHWTLERGITFLNHGSFGACPRVVLERQSQLRAEMEAQPVRFLHRELEARLDEARAVLAELVGCESDDLAFVPNATTGVNTVLRSLTFAPGDEILITDHGYNACRNVVDYVAEKSGAHVVTAKLPFPVASEDQLIGAVLEAVTERTRLLLIDHVTSPTGIVLPVAEIIAALRERGIDTMVDGAHGPGMLPLDLDKLGAAYYTGNCHKWLCAPKGAALLHVRRDRQSHVRPSTISHGANDGRGVRGERSRFRLESDFLGTADYTAYLSVPAAIEFLRDLMPGGIPALREHNKRLVLGGRDRLCEALGIQKPVPDSCLGSLAAVPLQPASAPSIGPQALDPLHVALWEDHRIEVPVMTMALARPQQELRLLRIAGQAYNSPEQFEHLGKTLKTLV